MSALSTAEYCARLKAENERYLEETNKQAEEIARLNDLMSDILNAPKQLLEFFNEQYYPDLGWECVLDHETYEYFKELVEKKVNILV